MHKYSIVDDLIQVYQIYSFIHRKRTVRFSVKEYTLFKCLIQLTYIQGYRSKSRKSIIYS